MTAAFQHVTQYTANRSGVASDGSPTWDHQSDADNEAIVRQAIEERFSCKLHRYPRLHAIDYYAERHDRLVAHIEVKTRSHRSDKFPTVFLNVRKFMTLQLAALSVGVPSLFVVGFTNGIAYINVANIHPDVVRIGGNAQRVKSSSDREPVIDVHIDAMSFIDTGETAS